MSEYIMKSTSNGWGEYVGELIRCKDCKKNDTSACAMGYWDMETGEFTVWNKPNEYCSRAERKEE